MDAELIFYRLMDILRARLEPFVALEVSLLALTWAKLSALDELPEGLSLKEDVIFNSAREFFEVLSELPSNDGQRRGLYDFEPILVRDVVSNQTILNVQMRLQDALKSGVLKDFTLPPSFVQSFAEGDSHLQVTDELVQVMLKLAGDLAGRSVYCPHDGFLQIADHAARIGASPFVELSLKSTIPWSLQILNEVDVQTQFGDPLRSPSYIERGKLKKFDVTIAFPPMGNRGGDGVVESDLFHRFPERTSSLPVLDLRHMMAQTQEKAVIAVPNSILFSRGVEHTFRKDLLEQGMVEAVISMPAGLLPNLVGVAFSILVLDIKGNASSVRFMDGSGELFSEKIGRGRVRLTHWEKLLEVYQALEDDSLVRKVSVREILDNDASLEVTQYLLSTEIKKVNQLLGTSEACELQQLVEMIRPTPRLYTDGEVAAIEVGVGDFPDFGHLNTPTKQVEINPSFLKGKGTQQFLRPGDIIIVVKGSVGRLALVPDDIPPPGENGWVVNQSCMILRATRGINPVVLFMYLRSDVGQTLIQRIVSGATTHLIQLRSLQELPVILPPLEEARAVTETFEKQARLQEQIAMLNQEQQRLDKTHWHL